MKRWSKYLFNIEMQMKTTEIPLYTIKMDIFLKGTIPGAHSMQRNSNSHSSLIAI